MKVGVATSLLLLSLAGTAWADPAALSDSDAARAAKNPLDPMVKLPIENQTNFGYGPADGVQDQLKFKPVVPVQLPGEWSLVSRTIVPIVWDPPTKSDSDRSFGLGDMQPTLWVTPSDYGEWRWGFGPMFQFPTATSESLGKGKWAAGPSFVVVDKGAPWGLGLLVWNLWSFAGDPDRPPFQELTIQPQLQYFFDDGWYLTTSPIVTADWQAEPDDRWTLPVGGGLGRAFHLAGQTFALEATFYDNVITPTNGPDWQVQLELQLLFPE